ncbi:MAG: response regulator [Blautia sp.]|nr:response regulator [Blautia sp.]MCM1200667.1 response regulator [Bacteroides fragilis]
MKSANKILKSLQTFLVLFISVVVIVGLFVFMSQRSHRRILEKEDDVQYREELFSILANNTNDVFLMFTTDDYTVEYISPNVERVLGVPQEKAGADIHILDEFLAADRGNLSDFVEGIARDGFVSYEGEWAHKMSGERRWFVETVYITSVNDSERYVAVLSGRTQEQKNRKALMEALEIAKSANESKSVFLSNMSHDIRTPMNAIVGFSALLQRDAYNPEKVQEYTRKISASSQHLLGLINDVLDMSKIESGKTTLNISEISLAEIVDELISMMQPQAKAKNLVDLMGGTLSVESELDKGSTFTLGLELRIKEEDVDPDFWEKHGVTNLLVVDDEEDICKGIRYVMSDTGVNIKYALGGLSAVNMAQRAQNDGNGFDLVLIDWQMPDIDGIETSRRIRKIVPSDVPIMILSAYDLSEIEEEGIAAGIDGFLQKPFFLSNFRSIVQNLKARNKTGEKPAEQDGILAGKHILAAEDIELNMEILMELLKMAGADCEWAQNGQEALEKFEQSKEGQYDIILMDIQMPVMNGYDATRAIRACSHPQAKSIPIVAMTANAFSEDVKDALAAGMNAHVAKPIDMEQLKAAMREVLAQQ